MLQLRKPVAFEDFFPNFEGVSEEETEQAFTKGFLLLNMPQWSTGHAQNSVECKEVWRFLAVAGLGPRIQGSRENKGGG